MSEKSNKSDKTTLAFWSGYFQHQWGNTVHKFWILVHTFDFCIQLLKRAFCHDTSKYRWSEAKIFARTINDLEESTYGDEEYDKLLEKVDDAIKRHYERNDHHPEHHDDSIGGMTMFQLIEMIIDWYAATKKHNDGDIYQSIQHNKKQYDIEPEIVDLLTSVADHFCGNDSDRDGANLS